LTANHYGVAVDQLWRSTRGRGVKSPARSVAMYLCQEVASKSLSEIAAGFNLASYVSAGSSIRSVRLKLAEDPRINDSTRLIKLDLTRLVFCNVWFDVFDLAIESDSIADAMGSTSC